MLTLAQKLGTANIMPKLLDTATQMQFSMRIVVFGDTDKRLAIDEPMRTRGCQLYLPTNMLFTRYHNEIIMYGNVS